ncbi:hypothetical protein PTKIN_Ptkin14bG0206900 [Pterospermum kingtungense]
MPKPKPQLPWFGLMAAVALFQLPQVCIARSINKDCGFTFCGEVNISNPFRLTTQPCKCGYPSFVLECDRYNRTSFVTKHGRFYVRNISYEHGTVRVIDANLGRERGDCSLPTNSLLNSDIEKGLHPYDWSYQHYTMYLVNCTKPMNYSMYINASRCSTPPSSNFYFLDTSTPPLYMDQSCTIAAVVPFMLQNISGLTSSDIYKKLFLGIEIDWYSNPGYKESFQEM